MKKLKEVRDLHRESDIKHSVFKIDTDVNKVYTAGKRPAVTDDEKMAAFWQPSLVTVWQAETGEWVGCRITCGSTGIHDAGRVLGFGGEG